MPIINYLIIRVGRYVGRYSPVTIHTAADDNFDVRNNISRIWGRYLFLFQAVFIIFQHHSQCEQIQYQQQSSWHKSLCLCLKGGNKDTITNFTGARIRYKWHKLNIYIWPPDAEYLSIKVATDCVIFWDHSCSWTNKSLW